MTVSPKCCGFSPDTWKEAAQACTTWYSLINTGVTASEEHRISEAIQKCQQNSRARNSSMSDLPQALPGHLCNRFHSTDGSYQPSPHPQHHWWPLILIHSHLWHWRMNITYICIINVSVYVCVNLCRQTSLRAHLSVSVMHESPCMCLCM